MLWSHEDPVTVLGAARTMSGWPEVGGLFDWLATNFTNGTLYELEVTAAGVSGDLGYVSAPSTRWRLSVVRRPPK